MAAGVGRLSAVAGFQQGKKGQTLVCEGTSKGKAGLSSQVTKDGTRDQSGDLVTVTSQSPVT